MFDRSIYQKFLEFLSYLEGSSKYYCSKYKCKHGISHLNSHNKVYWIGKKGCEGWDIANDLKREFNSLYFVGLSTVQFYDLPIHVYGDFVEVDIV